MRSCVVPEAKSKTKVSSAGGTGTKLELAALHLVLCGVCLSVSSIRETSSILLRH